MPRKIHPAYSSKLAALISDPQVRDALYGWTMSLEHPGYVEWSHPSRPNGWLSATPDHSEDGVINTEWWNFDGKVEPGPVVPVEWTGTDPSLDAALYLHRITPYLMLTVSQSLGGKQLGLANSVKSVVCGMEAAAFLNEHSASAQEALDYIREIALERGCPEAPVRKFVAAHLYDERLAKEIAKGNKNMFGLFNIFRRGRRSTTTRQRRRMPQSDFALPIKDQGSKFKATHPKFVGAYPMADRSHGANARGRAIQMLNSGHLSLKEARTVFSRTSRKWGFEEKDIVQVDGRWKSVPAAAAPQRAAANRRNKKWSFSPDGARHMRKGGMDYVDTAFMNRMRQVNPQWDLTHMGFGEFYLADFGEGRVDFAREDQWGSGHQIPGASGRTHRFYDNKDGKLTRKIIRAMEKAGASTRVSGRAPKAGSKNARRSGRRNRSISTIAREIQRDWGAKVNYAAVPYLQAMTQLHSIDDAYGYDTGRGIVARFLGNAGSWRGPKAKEIKAELRKMLKG